MKCCLRIGAVLFAILGLGFLVGSILLAGFSYQSGGGDLGKVVLNKELLGAYLGAGVGLASALLFLAALIMQAIELAETRRVAEQESKALQAQGHELAAHTTQLTRQNELARFRVNTDLILKLAEPRSRRLAHAAIHCMIDQALSDWQRGLELVELFWAVGKGGEIDPRWLADEITSAAGFHRDELMDRKIPELNRSWEKMVEEMLVHDEDYRRRAMRVQSGAPEVMSGL